MRVAVFSDVHGNPYACEAVLAATKAAGTFDATICAGDFTLNGSDPAACVDMIRAAGVVALAGNVEGYVLQPDVVPPDALHANLWHEIQPVAEWTREQLGPERLAWLAGVPFGLRFSPSAEAREDLLVVHGNPKDVLTFIMPPVDVQQAVMGKVVQPDDDPELLAVMAGVTAQVVAFGHFHLMSERLWQGMRLVNVSPCSYARFDHDPRARFTEFVWQPAARQWAVTRHRVEYAVERELVALRTGDIPGGVDLAAKYL